MSTYSRYLDACGMKCPIPVLRATKELRKMAQGETLEIRATDGQAPRDFKDYCTETGNRLLSSKEEAGVYVMVVEKG